MLAMLLGFMVTFVSYVFAIFSAMYMGICMSSNNTVYLHYGEGMLAVSLVGMFFGMAMVQYGKRRLR